MQRAPLEPFLTQEALINFWPRMFLHLAMHSGRVQGSMAIANAESTGCASIAITVTTKITVNIFANFSAMNEIFKTFSLKETDLIWSIQMCKKQLVCPYL